MARTLRTLFTTATLGLAITACDDGATSAPNGASDAPSFSPSGKHDNAEQAIRYIQGVGTQAQVQGRFQQELKWRGFTFEAQQGQKIQVAMTAQMERNGLLLEQAVDTQILLYGPADSEDALFEQVIADSGLAQKATLDVELQADGFYLLAATRDEAVQQAQFELEIECPNCGAQDGVDDDLLCEPGKLFVEGSKLKSQDWTRCNVIVLEPTTLPADEKLVIGPDVHVRAHYYITDFHPEGWGETRITIDGELDMLSDPEHRIVFETNVEGKQWDGIRLNRPGVVMHDFVLKDTHEGLHIQSAAEGARIVNGEFMLNRFGLRLRGAPGIELENLKIHDNQTGVENLGTRSQSYPLDSLFFLDSELWLNEVPVRLISLEGSYLDGLYVHDNDNGISLTTNGAQTDQPENWVTVSNSRFLYNGYGIDMRGNGTIDHVEILRSGTYGVRTSNGWQKVKNSILEGNSTECVTPDELRGYTQDWFMNCGALSANFDGRTVFRNNIVEKNDGFGVVMVGQATVPRQARGGFDPAVLNSNIEGNGRAGIAIVDAPMYSVEFNQVKDNADGAIQLIYSSGSRLAQWAYNRETMQQEITSASVRPNRIQRNNFETDATPFERLIYIAINQGQVDPLTFDAINTQRLNNTFSTTLTLSNNWLPEADVALLEELDGFTGFTVMPLLDAPEETAGLIREIAPFDEE